MLLEVHVSEDLLLHWMPNVISHIFCCCEIILITEYIIIHSTWGFSLVLLFYLLSDIWSPLFWFKKFTKILLSFIVFFRKTVKSTLNKYKKNISCQYLNGLFNISNTMPLTFFCFKFRYVYDINSWQSFKKA